MSIDYVPAAVPAEPKAEPIKRCENCGHVTDPAAQWPHIDATGFRDRQRYCVNCQECKARA